jgi:NAD(P)-dependent dehydrogenase (short-subunit alcohol dehydrogenase family)
VSSLRQRLEGRTAIVTGGAAGIGRAISERFAAEGAKVAIFDLDAAAAEATATALAGRGHRVLACAVDVADRAQVERATGEVRRELGAVDILVNNAGMECILPFMSLDEERWNRVFAVNMTSMLHCTQLALPDMLAARWGRIINISSAAAQRGSAVTMSCYAASKGAVISFTRSLAFELGGQGVTVNCVAPNFILTPMQLRSAEEHESSSEFLRTRVAETPVGRAGQPEDMAAVCAYLASPESGYVTAQTIGVNGGRVP